MEKRKKGKKIPCSPVQTAASNLLVQSFCYLIKFIAYLPKSDASVIYLIYVLYLCMYKKSTSGPNRIRSLLHQVSLTVDCKTHSSLLRFQWEVTLTSIESFFYNEMKQWQCFLVKVHREIVLELYLELYPVMYTKYFLFWCFRDSC